MGEPLPFKYHLIDAQGRQATTFRKKALLDDQQLVLDKEVIQVECLRMAGSRMDRLILVTQEPGRGQMARTMIVGRKTLRQVVPAINARISARDCAHRAEELRRSGRGHEYRQEICPGCRCTIDLSRHLASPELYCRYCDTIWTLSDADPVRRREEAGYRCCDQCGLYAHPTQFTSGYFIFLVVAYMYKSSTREVCNSCMRGEAWKMVGVNLLGLVGEVFAVPNLIRAYAGGSARSKTFAGLDSGNACIKGRKYEKGFAHYDEILNRLGHCAGVRYNYGIGMMADKQFDKAGLMLARALEDCANYANAAEALAICYEKLGMTAELDMLKQEWAGDGADQPETATASA